MINKKFKLVVELAESKECLISESYTLRELIKKPLRDLSVDLQAITYDVSNELNEKPILAVPISKPKTLMFILSY